MTKPCVSTIIFLVCLLSACSPRQKGVEFPKEAKVEETDLGIVGEETAQNLVDFKIKALKKLITVKKDPYTGKENILTQCQEKNLPPLVKESGDWGFFSLQNLYSTSPNILGMCFSPKKLVKTQYLLIFCKKKGQLFEVKTFYSKDEEWSTKPFKQCH